jgi:sarcosine oxidase gamma subunit
MSAEGVSVAETLTLVLGAEPGPGAIPVAPNQWLWAGKAPEGALVIDVSDTYQAFEVTENILAQGIGLDFAKLPADFAGRTRLGEIGVLLSRAGDIWMLRCERSYAEWVGEWIRTRPGGT